VVKLSLSFANFVFKSELDENYISILSVGFKGADKLKCLGTHKLLSKVL